MHRHNPKHQLQEQFAQVAKALSHAHKLELLELLAQGERSVEVLTNVADLSVANTSRHLQQLRLEEGFPEWKAAGLPVD